MNSMHKILSELPRIPEHLDEWIESDGRLWVYNANDDYWYTDFEPELNARPRVRTWMFHMLESSGQTVDYYLEQIKPD